MHPGFPVENIWPPGYNLCVNWRDLAACAGMELALFFPPENIGGPRGGRGVSGERKRVNKAKAVCSGCPVKWECLQFAVLHDCTGIYGGTDTAERRMR